MAEFTRTARNVQTPGSTEIVVLKQAVLFILAFLAGLMTAAGQTLPENQTVGLSKGDSFTFSDGSPGVQMDLASPLIHLSQARTKYSSITGAGYTIAVLDSGVDYTHPALAGRNRGGYDFVNDDSDPDDDNGHGTHVTGIVASSDGTYTGIAPQAGYAGVKILASDGSGDWDNIENGLQWVIDNRETYNIVAINMSFGTAGTYNGHILSVLSDELSTLKDAGVFISAAAGNGWYSHQPNEGVSYPAADPSAASVGDVWTANFGGIKWSSGAIDYTTSSDRIVSHCDRSTTMLDLFAPGAIITSAAYNWEGANPDFVAKGGTSMAAPMVAGLATLIRETIEETWAVEDQPTGAEWQDVILQVMKDSGTLIYDGDDEDDNVTNLNANFRRIDVLAALDAVYVPEPSSIVLLTFGIAGWIWLGKRKTSS